jgi:hypothetical protein
VPANAAGVFLPPSEIERNPIAIRLLAEMTRSPTRSGERLHIEMLLYESKNS